MLPVDLLTICSIVAILANGFGITDMRYKGMGEAVERVRKDSKVLFWGDFIEPCVVMLHHHWPESGALTLDKASKSMLLIKYH